jgi:hypothetical protein
LAAGAFGLSLCRLLRRLLFLRGRSGGRARLQHFVSVLVDGVFVLAGEGIWLLAAARASGSAGPKAVPGGATKKRSTTLGAPFSSRKLIRASP